MLEMSHDPRQETKENFKVLGTTYRLGIGLPFVLFDFNFD